MAKKKKKIFDVECVINWNVKIVKVIFWDTKSLFGKYVQTQLFTF